MKLPFRKKVQPIIEQQPEQVEDDQPFENVEPAIPMHPAIQVHPELMQFCASCGTIGATVPLKVSYFGYVDLPFVKICDVCEEARKAAKERHYVPLRKTLLETPAIPKPRKKALVSMRTPSRPLDDRPINLALEA